MSSLFKQTDEEYSDQDLKAFDSKQSAAVITQKMGDMLVNQYKQQLKLFEEAYSKSYEKLNGGKEVTID